MNGNSATVVADSFPNSPRQLIVCPIAGAGLWIRGYVRRVHLSGKALQEVHVLARAQRPGQDRRFPVRPVMLRMASHAVDHMIHQISSARQPCWRVVELPCRQRPRPRGPMNGRQPMVKEMAPTATAAGTANTHATIFPSFFIDPS